MPKRMIDSEIWKNEKFGYLGESERLLFIGIFSNADDDGRLRGGPAYLKALVFPYDTNKSNEDLLTWRDILLEAGLIFVYSTNGREYISLPGWSEHQLIRKDRYHPSRLPSPPDNPATTTGIPSVTQAVPQSNLIQSNLIDYCSSIGTRKGEDNPFIFYDRNIGKVASDYTRDTITDWINTYGEDAVMYALKQAKDASILTNRYIEGVLEGKGEGRGRRKPIDDSIETIHPHERMPPIFIDPMTGKPEEQVRYGR